MLSGARQLLSIVVVLLCITGCSDDDASARESAPGATDVIHPGDVDVDGLPAGPMDYDLLQGFLAVDLSDESCASAAVMMATHFVSSYPLLAQPGATVEGLAGRFTVGEQTVVARVGPDDQGPAFLLTSYGTTIAFEDRARSGGDGPFGAWCNRDEFEQTFRAALAVRGSPEMLALDAINGGDSAWLAGQIIEILYTSWTGPTR